MKNEDAIDGQNPNNNEHEDNSENFVSEIHRKQPYWADNLTAKIQYVGFLVCAEHHLGLILSLDTMP